MCNAAVDGVAIVAAGAGLDCRWKHTCLGHTPACSACDIAASAVAGVKMMVD
jgi:hypothetical protein